MKPTKATPPALPRKTGRPLSFDREEAVRKAMLLFWRHGYEATSLQDLTKALGIAPPSLYAAFGDKKGLFREAVGRYVGRPVIAETVISDAATAYDAAKQLLQGSLVGFTGTGTPAGCLLATSAISVSAGAAGIQTELAAIRRGIEKQLRNKIIEDMKSGLIPKHTDADALAGHVIGVIQGLSTLARDGAKREKLARVADIAMMAWPRSG